jgi:hypothetical protein
MPEEINGREDAFMTDDIEPRPKQPPVGAPRSQRAPIPGPVPASETQRSTFPPGGPALQSLRPPAYGQGVILSVVVAAVVLVLAIIAAGEGEEASIPMLENTKPIFWGLAALLIIGAGAFAQFVEINTVRLSNEGTPLSVKQDLPTAWAGPVIATLASVLLVATYHNTSMLLIGPAVAFIGNASTLFARDLLSDATTNSEKVAFAVHAGVLHILAFLALAIVYLNKMPALWGPLLAFFIATILYLELLDTGKLTSMVRVVYAAAGGWIVAQSLVLLNWWPTWGWPAGTVMLVCFALVSMALVSLARDEMPKRSQLALFSGAAVIALAALAYAS